MFHMPLLCFLIAFAQQSGYVKPLNTTPKVILQKEDKGQIPYVILISVDGLRYDYVDLFGARNLKEFEHSGVSANMMMPVYPSSTFPNHYSIATGMYPANHGILSNRFYSRERQSWYAMHDIDAVTDGSWYRGEPIWNLAERSGIRAATCFWIGSEAQINGMRPTYYLPYDGAMTNQSRFDQMEDWLRLPEKERPHFIAGYFSTVDQAGHRHGAYSGETRQATLDFDQLFGGFLERISATNLPINVIVVSDHGMSDITYGIVLPEIVNLYGCEVSYSFPPMIYCDDPERLQQISAELKADRRIEVFTPDTCPDLWKMKAQDGVGDLILNVNPPYIVIDKPKLVTGATHGYDPNFNPEMGAYFAASGVSFKENFETENFTNIQLYPLIAEILGLKTPLNIDGRLEVLKPLLKPIGER